MKCTFLGHADVTDEIEVTLQKVIIELIESGEVDMFYVRTVEGAGPYKGYTGFAE